MPAVDELASRPWDYPGARAPYTGVLHRGRFSPLVASDVGGVIGVAGRHLVVAVGSNASPSVMRRKLERGGVNSTVVFLLGTVSGLRIGHSAHVSMGGYVAATPVRAPGDRDRPVVALLLDEEQLECLDLTEPNYERVLVPAEVCRLDLEGGARPDGFSVYVSRWGALVDAGGTPVGLTTQEALFDWVRSRCPRVAELLGRWPDLPATMRALAGDPGLRVRVRELLDSDGCSGPTGFSAG